MTPCDGEKVVGGTQQRFFAGIRGSSLPLAVILAAAGFALGLGYKFRILWRMWTSDGVRSIGLLFLPVSALLCTRAWRGYKRGVNGTWWGFALMAAAVAVARIQQ